MKRKLMALLLTAALTAGFGGSVFAASGTYGGVTWNTASTCTTTRAYLCMTSNTAAELEGYGTLDVRRNGSGAVSKIVMNPYGETVTRISDVRNVSSPQYIASLSITYKVKGHPVYSEIIRP